MKLRQGVCRRQMLGHRLIASLTAAPSITGARSSQRSSSSCLVVDAFLDLQFASLGTHSRAVG
jgi:hypothetical protein